MKYTSSDLVQPVTTATVTLPTVAVVTGCSESLDVYFIYHYLNNIGNLCT